MMGLAARQGTARVGPGTGEKPVDPFDRIDEIIALGEGARSVPMSRTNCVLDRGEVIGLLDLLRPELPCELRREPALLDERDKILDSGRHDADSYNTDSQS